MKMACATHLAAAAVLLLCAVALPHGVSAAPTPEQGVLALYTEGTYCSDTTGEPVFFTPGEDCFFNPYASYVPGFSQSLPGEYARVWFNTSDGEPLYEAFGDRFCSQLVFAAQLPQSASPSLPQWCPPIALTVPTGGSGVAAPFYPPEGFVATVTWSNDIYRSLLSSLAVPQGRDIVQGEWEVTRAVYCGQNDSTVTIVQRTLPTRWSEGNITLISVAPTSGGPAVNYICGDMADPPIVPTWPEDAEYLTTTLYQPGDSQCTLQPYYTTQSLLGTCVADPVLGLSYQYECPVDGSDDFTQGTYDEPACGGSPGIQSIQLLACSQGVTPNFAYSCGGQDSDTDARIMKE